MVIPICFLMEHLAILKEPFFSFLQSGEKTIESRWYKTKRIPYRKIKKGEVIYFKKSGQKVSLKAKVSKVLFFDELDENKIKHILDTYGKEIKIKDTNIESYKGLKYCTLVFIENLEKIEPFSIDKTGFGNMSAWIRVDSINQIKVL
jgi:ASC-1-like (ASCH) protein